MADPTNEDTAVVDPSAQAPPQDGGDDESESAKQDADEEGQENQEEPIQDPAVVVKISNKKAKGDTKSASKRSRSPTTPANKSGNVDAMTFAQLQLLLYPPTHNSTPLDNVPNAEQVRAIVSKACTETPPYVHLSAKDCSSTFKLDHKCRLELKNNDSAMGYRMIRASHGASPPENRVRHYYYEVLVSSEQPTSADISRALSKHVRIGRGLAHEWELLAQLEQAPNPEHKSRTEQIHEATQGSSLMLAAHLRLGYSMRTGDLDAPVGYDKWSYGVRDVRGSKVHQSKREDGWGRGHNVSFGPGDVVGCMITLAAPEYLQQAESDNESNHETSAQVRVTSNQIRFFCNGKSMGALESPSRNVRTGGEAYSNVPAPSTYYPAISTYMGANCRANFGPYFIYPPAASQLPSGSDWRRVPITPISDACHPPSEETNKRRKIPSKKTQDEVWVAYKAAAQAELEVRQQVYATFEKSHVEFVRNERAMRGLSMEGLPTNDGTLKSDGAQDEAKSTASADPMKA